jgi:hypothetical protein
MGDPMERASKIHDLFLSDRNDPEFVRIRRRAVQEANQSVKSELASIVCSGISIGMQTGDKEMLNIGRNGINILVYAGVPVHTIVNCEEFTLMDSNAQNIVRIWIDRIVDNILNRSVEMGVRRKSPRPFRRSPRRSRRK